MTLTTESEWSQHSIQVESAHSIQVESAHSIQVELLAQWYDQDPEHDSDKQKVSGVSTQHTGGVSTQHTGGAVGTVV